MGKKREKDYCISDFENYDLEYLLEELEEENNRDQQILKDIYNEDRVPTLEEIEQMLKEDEEEEAKKREFYKQLEETSKKLDKLNNWLDKRYEELGLNRTFEAVREAKYRKIVKDEKFDNDENFIKEYRKMNEENKKYLEENNLPYVEISGNNKKKKSKKRK